MISSIDHLIIAVKDINDAEENYRKIFGMEPVWKGEHKALGTANVIFNFKNTYFELLSANGDGLGAELVNSAIEEQGDGLIGVVFGTNNIEESFSTLKKSGYLVTEPTEGEGIDNKTQKIRKWKNLFLPPELTRGIFSFIIEHSEGALPSLNKYPKATINKLDHLVINTNDANGFINIYKDIFNIRLALDKVIEHWKSRMLFFRVNKTTIEVIERKNEDDSQDSLWGLAWEVESIEEAYKRLISEGVDVTPIKEGLKENTLVATIKSHTHNVPTLLIEHT
ncbi:VOC family protein [Gammaproteobacteria bacterium]|jgi:catechol 2,3-dioxygenase-like lactoylglutathione lyase family enzyme|nr:VOC family protein [Gammaproteobacteria bacterium]